MLALAAVAVTAGCADSELKQEAEPAAAAPATTEHAPAEQATAESQPEARKPAGPGDSITLAAGPDKVQVRLVSMTDPIEPPVDPYLGEAMDVPSAGHRFVGVTLKLTNVGTEPYDPSWAGTSALVMSNDVAAEEGLLVDSPPWSTTSNAKIAPATLTINAPFEAPLEAQPGRFQYTVSGNTLDESTGEWRS